MVSLRGLATSEPTGYAAATKTVTPKKKSCTADMRILLREEGRKEKEGLVRSANPLRVQGSGP